MKIIITVLSQYIILDQEILSQLQIGITRENATMLSDNDTRKLSIISPKESRSKQAEGGELLGHHLEIIAPANEESECQIMEIANEEVEVSKLIKGKSEKNLSLIKRYFYR